MEEACRNEAVMLFKYRTQYTCTFNVFMYTCILTCITDMIHVHVHDLEIDYTWRMCQLNVFKVEIFFS